eukprot:3951462-Karenia_brevis.AAC.1
MLVGLGHYSSIASGVQLPKVARKPSIESTRMSIDVSVYSARLFEDCWSGSAFLDCSSSLDSKFIPAASISSTTKNFKRFNGVAR